MVGEEVTAAAAVVVVVTAAAAEAAATAAAVAATAIEPVPPPAERSRMTFDQHAERRFIPTSMSTVSCIFGGRTRAFG